MTPEEVKAAQAKISGKSQDGKSRPHQKTSKESPYPMVAMMEKVLGWKAPQMLVQAFKDLELEAANKALRKETKIAVDKAEGVRKDNFGPMDGEFAKILRSGRL